MNESLLEGDYEASVLEDIAGKLMSNFGKYGGGLRIIIGGFG